MNNVTLDAMAAISTYITLLRKLGLDPLPYTWVIGNGG